MSSTHQIRRVLTLSVSAILLMSTQACATTLPGTGSCTLTADDPHDSSTKPGHMDGKGKVKCVYSQGVLTNLSIETKLQKKNASGSWVDATGSTDTTTKATAESGVTYTGVSGFIICQEGTFRTASRAGGHLDGSYSGLSTREYGRAITNPCD